MVAFVSARHAAGRMEDVYFTVTVAEHFSILFLQNKPKDMHSGHAAVCEQSGALQTKMEGESSLLYLHLSHPDRI